MLLYLLSDSFSEVFLIVGSLILGLPLPITAAQILWVNLANDSLPNLALTLEPKEDDLLERRPRKIDEPIVNGEIGLLIGTISFITGGLILTIFWWLLSGGMDVELARTIAFTTLGVDSLIYVFSARSLRAPIWRDSFWKNMWLIGAVGIGFMIQLAAIYVPVLQRFLHTQPLSFSHWGIVLGTSLVVIIVIELVKECYWRWWPDD